MPPLVGMVVPSSRKLLWFLVEPISQAADVTLNRCVVAVVRARGGDFVFCKIYKPV
jgi:hypothetical protein